MGKFLIIILVSCTISASLWANSRYPLVSLKDTQRFERLLKEFRCLVCQNQDLSDSNAPLALDLRKQIYSMVKANKDDEAIAHYLTRRYGTFILFKPPFEAKTYGLWFGPLLFLLFGLGLFCRLVPKDASK